MSDETKTETILDKANNIAGMQLDIKIDNGVFMVTPSEGGIMLLAALNDYEAQIKEAWEAVDDMARELEEKSDENSLFREMLTDVAGLMEYSGMEREARIINEVLYKVTGITEDGEEFTFVWNTDEDDEDAPLAWVNKTPETEEAAQ